VVLSAFILGIPEHKLRLVSPDVGGGFGSKIPTYPEEALVPWAARRVGRPVKWVATRSESAVSDTQGRDHVTVCKLALKSDGTITGLHAAAWANNGAYISLVASLIPTAFYVTLM
jgi:carbon-monoxide dehydrogenase large subunit